MLEKDKIIIKIFLNFIFISLLTLIGVNILLKEDLFKSINLNGQTNDYCQTIKNFSNSSLDYLICDNKFKKKKIIFLLIDGLPFDRLKDLVKFKENKFPNFFRGEGVEYKQTGALFETIFTGKFSRNYLPSSNMLMDNLALQFKNAGMDIFYQVGDFPLGILINKKLGKKFEEHNGESIPLSYFCKEDLNPFHSFEIDVENNYTDKSKLLFKEGYNVDILYERANEKLKKYFEPMNKQYNKCFEKNNFDSTIFYSSRLDHHIHVSHKNYPLVLYYIYFIEQKVKEIIKWINDEHGEFAFVLASDHGGQDYYGEDSLSNHGRNYPGNEAVLFVYTKELGENYEKYKIIDKDVPVIPFNDFSCIISQTFKDVNYPLESTCTPRIIGNDNLLKFTSIKSKEIQLKKYIEKLCEKYPELNEQYHGKYDSKLNNHKFYSYFKDMDSIYKADNKFYEEYKNYLMNIQKELNIDVVKSGQTKIYYCIFYIVLISFICGFFYYFREIILITKEKVLKEVEKGINNKNTHPRRLLRYFYILIILLILEPIMCLIFNNSKNISHIINISIFIKYFSLLILLFGESIINQPKNKNNFRKILLIILIILIIHFIMYKIEFFCSLDKYFNSEAKNNFIKIYISYPLLVIYSCIEFYTYRNYYFGKKCEIRYLYIIIPFLIFISYFMLKFDLYVRQIQGGHPPEIIFLMRKTYILIISLLLFIKPLVKKDNEERKVVPNVVINLKLFLIVIISFICIEIERVLLISLFCLVLFYLCHCFHKETDIFLKVIYLIVISCYPQIHFIGNQGTYSLDTSIKVTKKCPSKWADDLPVVMGIIFVIHKFRLFILCTSYVFTLIKITKNKAMNYYTKLIRLFYQIQLFGMIICYLFFFKNVKENAYIQMLVMIATKAIPLLVFDLAFFFNYIIYRILNWIYKTNIDLEYKEINEINSELIENQISI